MLTLPWGLILQFFYFIIFLTPFEFSIAEFFQITTSYYGTTNSLFSHLFSFLLPIFFLFILFLSFFFSSNPLIFPHSSYFSIGIPFISILLHVLHHFTALLLYFDLFLIQDKPVAFFSSPLFSSQIRFGFFQYPYCFSELNDIVFWLPSDSCLVLAC